MQQMNSGIISLSHAFKYWCDVKGDELFKQFAFMCSFSVAEAAEAAGLFAVNVCTCPSYYFAFHLLQLCFTEYTHTHHVLQAGNGQSPRHDCT